jgi:hypothetical protein
MKLRDKFLKKCCLPPRGGERIEVCNYFFAVCFAWVLSNYSSYCSKFTSVYIYYIW